MGHRVTVVRPLLVLLAAVETLATKFLMVGPPLHAPSDSLPSPAWRRIFNRPGVPNARWRMQCAHWMRAGRGPLDTASSHAVCNFKGVSSSPRNTLLGSAGRLAGPAGMRFSGRVVSSVGITWWSFD
ncbi:unnamed protein product [Prorocentrum cordatum]|uniref:Secreted protein n=1 Tax=Prorocentrum cordatum TaxID=2364126 RepID=A0ABN9U4E0_9DINO|nr:unnamed protein product [Polarella glacialis]